MNITQQNELRAAAKSFAVAAQSSNLKALCQSGQALAAASDDSVTPFRQTRLYDVVAPVVDKMRSGHRMPCSAWFVIQKETDEQLGLWVERVCAGRKLGT